MVLCNIEDTPEQHNMNKIGGVETPKLRSYIDRIERLDEDRAGIASDIRDVFAEAKSNGFDVPTLRAVLKLRKMKASERTEREYMLDLYKRALQMDLFDEPEGNDNEKIAQENKAAARSTY